MKKAWLVWEYCDHIDSSRIEDAQIMFEEPERWKCARIQEIVWTEVYDTK